MEALPDIHDHSLLEYRVDLANRQITLITLPEVARMRPNIKTLHTVFDGREAHHFDRVASGVIFLDIEEVPLPKFLLDHQVEFDEGRDAVGAPPWWRGSVAEAEVYLTGRNVHALEINSSYGFSGWVLATHVRQSAETPATGMKNIQIIDGASNAVYDVFQSTDAEFALIFPVGTDIAFSEDVFARGNERDLATAFENIWKRRIAKKDVQGIHGIVFYGLADKKQYYPTGRDEEAVNPDGTHLR